MTWFSDICHCKCSFSDIGVVELLEEEEGEEENIHF